MGELLSYLEELTKAMTTLAEHPKTLFVGQGVRYSGQRMHDSFAGVPMERRIEMPVAEDFQMGFCTGLALEGFIPVCVFPRFDFLLLAANQLVNHLDKIPLMSDYRPKMIIRTAVGSTSPLNPGPQHSQDHTQAFRSMLNTIPVVDATPESVDIAYTFAFKHHRSVIVVERMESY